MTGDALADSIMNDLVDDLIAEEKSKLLGPPCADGAHVPEGEGEYQRCSECARTVCRTNPNAPWVVTHGSGCECRECRVRWMKPTDAAPRFDMGTVSEGSFVTIEGASSFLDGKWRVRGFWRAWTKADFAGPEMPQRYQGENLCRTDDPTEATHVSLTAVCGAMMRVDAFRAFATITGHIDDPKPRTRARA